MQLDEALTDIANIRAFLDKNQAFRGFRSIAIGVSAVFVLIGAFVQLHFNVRRTPASYLDIWLTVAIGSLIITAVEMIIRGRRSNDLSVWKMHGRVALGLIPSFLTGAIVTGSIILKQENSMLMLNFDNLWILPGIWALIYSLGLFTVSNLLHRTTRFAAYYYLATGCVYLLSNWSHRTIEAWHMVAIFGVGQMVLAVILYWKVERNHV